MPLRNNILQQFTYTEFDLADVAQKLDQAENATLSAPNQNKKSYNLDDTGYFSISVLERALQVWDLTLVRWRGEAMKPFQAHPECVSAIRQEVTKIDTPTGTKRHSSCIYPHIGCHSVVSRLVQPRKAPRSDGTT